MKYGQVAQKLLWAEKINNRSEEKMKYELEIELSWMGKFNFRGRQWSIFPLSLVKFVFFFRGRQQGGIMLIGDWHLKCTLWC